MNLLNKQLITGIKCLNLRTNKNARDVFKDPHDFKRIQEVVRMFKGKVVGIIPQGNL